MASSSCAAAGGAAAAVPGKRKGIGASAALSSFLFLAVALAGMMTPAAAAVYKVGDSAGWTIIGNVNYTAWASSKTFHAGDTIVFEYNKQFHNVMEVSKADYRVCNPQSPLATHTSGNDSITLKRTGHRFFLCGIPGHCGLGQKVNIRVPKLASAARPARAPSSAASSPPTSSPASVASRSTAPAPQKNGAAQRVKGWALALVAMALAAAFVDLS